MQITPIANIRQKCQFIYANSTLIPNLQVIILIIYFALLDPIHQLMSQSSTDGYIHTEILCPRCERIPQRTIKTGKAFYTHVCFENCGKIYWTLLRCPGCSLPEKTVFVTEPKLGQLIECKNCAIKFYLFNCPRKQCQGLFFKSEGSYTMGQQVSCEFCQQIFKQIVCTCGQHQIFKPHMIIYQGQNSNPCNMCKKPLVYTHCKACNLTNYHHDRLDIGQKYKCSHCQILNEYIPCPTCGRSTKNHQFGYCKFFKCEYCYQGFEFSSCCHCSADNFHLGKEPSHPMRTCIDAKCKKNYFALGCHKCLTQVEIQNYKPNEAREQNCPNCKTELKFYHCPLCNKFNPKDSKCSNNNCPKPVSVKSYSKQAEERKRKEEQDKNKAEQQKFNKDYKEQECKVCFSSESTMANMTCLHVMMCAACHQKLQQMEHGKARNRNLRPNDVLVPCPICKKEGKYEKAFKYLYQ